MTRRYSSGFAAMDAGNVNVVSPQILASDQETMLKSPVSICTVVLLPEPFGPR